MLNTTGQRLAGGAFVAFVLIAAADFEPTAELAVAFAYLILLSTALTVGPVAFDRVTSLASGGA